MKEDEAPPFERIWRLVRRIPRGKVATYGQLSLLIDRRLTPVGVGWAIRAAPVGLVPWQRVVNGRGGISTDGEHPGLQRAILEREGVRFGPDGTIDLARYGWGAGRDRGMLAVPMAKKKKKVKAATKTTKRAAQKKPAAKAKPAKKAAAKKSVAKKTGAKKVVAKKTAAKKAIKRRDGAGHLDPNYAATLRKKSREGKVKDDDSAFIGRKGRTKDALAEGIAETWVASATSGEDGNEEAFNQDVPEDRGGPFVTTSASQEFATEPDESNPKGARREPFPRT